MVLVIALLSIIKGHVVEYTGAVSSRVKISLETITGRSEGSEHMGLFVNMSKLILYVSQPPSRGHVAEYT